MHVMSVLICIFNFQSQ